MLPGSTSVTAEQRLSLLIDAVHEYAIFMLDPQGIVMSWNTGARRIKGYTAEEIVGTHFSAFYTPDDIAAGKPERELEAALANGHTRDEGWRLRKDGTAFWANVTITAVHDDNGELTGFAKVTRDESDRKQALDQALRLDRLLQRERIANDLREGTVHRIFEAGLLVQGALRLIKDPVAVSRITDAVEVLDEAIKDIRTFVIGLGTDD